MSAQQISMRDRHTDAAQAHCPGYAMERTR